MRKKNLGILLFGLIIMLSIISGCKNNFIPDEHNGYLENRIESQLKSSGSWDLTGSPIFIDDNDPVYNWVVIETFYPWCSGLGTWKSPYIIENVTIDVLDGEYGIKIVNSTVPFIIRNCTISNSGSYVTPCGIKLDKVNNSHIFNNILYSIGTGIRLESSYNNTIENNRVFLNPVYGIHLYFYNYKNIVFNNSLYDNNEGITIITSNENEIYKNVLFQNSRGIDLQGTSEKNEVFENNILNSTNYGMYFYAAGGNKIKENLILNSLTGINLKTNSHENNFTRNVIHNSTAYGVYFDNTTAESTNNLFYNNSFNNPDGMNAFDDGATTNWNNSIIGNYWQDYAGQDLNDDLIGDTPYNIFPNSGRTDFLPIWYDPPDININSPVPYSFFGDNDNPPNFNIRITDPNLDTMWYTLNLESTKFIITQNDTIDQPTWSDFPDGDIPIRFYANDSGGNINYKQVIVIKDATAPIINVITPMSGEIFGVHPPNFQVYVKDHTLNSTWYSLDFGLTNFTFTDNGTIDHTTWSNLPDGFITIRFYANDTGGKLNYTDIIIEKERIPPEITINWPWLNFGFAETSPVFNVEINDPNLDSMWYSIDGGITNTTFLHNDTIDQSLWDNTLDGIITIIFFANDTAGNQNSSSVSVIKDTIAPLITIMLPTTNQIFGETPPDFQLSITEANLVAIWYTIDGGATNITIFGLIGSIDYIEWNSTPEGQVSLRFYVIDIMGRLIIDEVSIIKQIEEENGQEDQPIPGYNLYMLFAIISLTFLILLKKCYHPNLREKNEQKPK